MSLIDEIAILGFASGICEMITKQNNLKGGRLLNLLNNLHDAAFSGLRSYGRVDRRIYLEICNKIKEFSIRAKIEGQAISGEEALSTILCMTDRIYPDLTPVKAKYFDCVLAAAKDLVEFYGRRTVTGNIDIKYCEAAVNADEIWAGM